MKLIFFNTPVSLKIGFYFILFTFILSFSSCDKKLEYKEVKKDKSVFLSGEIIPDSHFLGDKKCKECHQNEFKKWKGSDHDKAMQIADSASVLANFNHQKFTSQGVLHISIKKEKIFL